MMGWGIGDGPHNIPYDIDRIAFGITSGIENNNENAFERVESACDAQ